MTILIFIAAFLLAFGGGILFNGNLSGSIPFLFECVNFLSWLLTGIITAVYIVAFLWEVINTIKKSYDQRLNLWQELRGNLNPKWFTKEDIGARLIDMGFGKLSRVIVMILIVLPLYRLGISLLTNQIVASFDWYGQIVDPVRFTFSLLGLLIMIVISGGFA